MCPKIVEGASHESLNKEKELMWKKHYGQGYVQESCWRWDARASLKPGVSHLSSSLLKSISLLYFSKQSICVFVIRSFLIHTERIKLFPQEISTQPHAVRSGILFVPFVWCSCCWRSSLKESILSNSWALFRKSSTWSILTANCIKETKDIKKHKVILFFITTS